MDLKEQRELTRAIRKELSEIDLLKEKMEHPDYKGAGELLRIDEARKRVAKLKRELILCGGEYKPTAKERRSEEFERNIRYISEIRLSVCNFVGGDSELTFRVCDGGAVIESGGFSVRGPIEAERSSVDKRRFLKCVSRLNIGEWRRNYDSSRFGIFFLDGVSWRLDFRYSGGKRTKRFGGSNAFPYNFEKLLKLFNAETVFGY